MRGVFWRANPRGTQERKAASGGSERGYWWIRWACPHGHLHREQVGPKKRAERDAERRRVEGTCPNRTPRPTRYLLADVIDEYIQSSRSHKRSWKDDARYAARWKARFNGRALDEIGPAELERLRSERLLGGTGQARGVTPATVNREIAFLKHVYNVAIRDGKTDQNPAARIRLLREPSGRVRYLTEAEEANLMEALTTDDQRQRVTVLLQTGLRKSEFLDLRWKDVDLKAGVLTIPRSKNGAARHVPMTSAVRALLSRLPRPLDGKALVFPNRDGQADRRWAEKIVPQALRDAKIDDFRLHDLRHTFASRLAMAGVDLLTIKELGGWKSLTMVQRYAHLSPGHRSQAIERLVTRTVGALTHAHAGAESHRE